MSLAAKMRRAPLRLVTGAYILNSGVTKLGADDDTAKAVHGMATGTYPVLGKLQPRTFLKVLGAAEATLGAALLLPVIPAGLAGLGLAGFSGALLALYWRTPGMHKEGDPRPTHQGMALSKDVWMFGIGSSLVLDAVLSEAKTTNDDPAS
jgi:hypothetical protein